MIQHEQQIKINVLLHRANWVEIIPVRSSLQWKKWLRWEFIQQWWSWWTSTQREIDDSYDRQDKDTEHIFHEAARRLNILFSRNVYNDVFADDVYYHKRCYDAVTYTFQPINIDTETKDSEDQLINNFFRKVE